MISFYNLAIERVEKMVKPKIIQTPRQHGLALVVIKFVHTLIFFSVEFCVLYYLYSGLTGRVTRLTKLAFGVVMCESLVFLGNNRRCPLTDLAEKLGSSHGSVTDIFLPGWFAKRIPEVSSILLATGLVAFGLRHFLDHSKE